MNGPKSKATILLAGIPAPGKSFFGTWLSDQQHFVHVDVESPGRLQSLGLDVAWQRMFEQHTAGPFVEVIGNLGPRVVLDWGFRPDWLHLVEDIRDSGVQLWWFDGDRKRARQEFVNRGTGSLADFDHQMAQIGFLWDDILEAFQPNILQVLDSAGIRMAPGEVWRHIIEHAA